MALSFHAAGLFLPSEKETERRLRKFQNPVRSFQRSGGQKGYAADSEAATAFLLL